MPVTDTHPDYDRMLPLWRKCRDTIAGEDRLKGAKVRKAYLPPLAGHVKYPAAYDHYVKNAVLFEAAGRTHQGLVGLIDRKAPHIEAPEVEPMQDFLEDVTGGGISAEEFAIQVASEVEAVGRCGILTDYPEGSTAGLSKSEVPASRRPYWVLYQAESVTNWWHSRDGGQDALTKVVFKEAMEAEGEDEFDREVKTRYRVFDLVEASVDGDPAVRRLRVRVYEPVEGKGKDETYQLVKTTWPKRGFHPATPVDEIEFTFVNERDTTWSTAEPPLLGLVNINLAHFRNSAALEHALALTAPTFYVSNYDPEKEGAADGTPGHIAADGSWIMGGYTVWTFKGDIRPGVLSLKAENLAPLETAMSRKEEQMVVLGARVLAPERRQPESGVAKKESRFGEASALLSTVNTASKALTWSLEKARDWLGLTGDVAIELNRDFFEKKMTPQDLIALADLWIRHRLIAKSDVRQAARDGELLGPERSDDVIDAELSSEGPPVPPDFDGLATDGSGA